MTEVTPEETERVFQHVQATQLEMQTRSKRARERVEAVLAEENCVLDWEGQFHRGRMEYRPLYVPLPLGAKGEPCSQPLANSPIRPSVFQSLRSRFQRKRS